ncbi:MAG: low molecular weight phosphatase family protein [Gammaproteobacteria bacterium]
MPRTILFLCPHHAAKSVLAVAHCTRLIERHGLDFDVDSGGTEPDAHVIPSVVALLREQGIDVSSQRPRRVSREQLEGAWRIISFGCGDADLSAAAVPVEQWLDVPLASEDVYASWEVIRAKVDALIEELHQA